MNLTPVRLPTQVQIPKPPTLSNSRFSQPMDFPHARPVKIRLAAGLSGLWPQQQPQILAIAPYLLDWEVDHEL